jgi:Phage spike trimer
MTMRIGIVVATHPEDHSVDLVMADDGSRLTGVQVMTPNGSARSGAVDMPSVPDSADKWDVSKTNGQDMKALVSFVGRTPVVTGFLYPQISQMTSTDPKTRIFRHQSDWLDIIDGDGNRDLQHPGGLKIRIGETPDHLDPAGTNADGNLAVDRNTGRRPFVRITMPGGTAVLTFTPDGAISLTCEQTIDVEAQGAITVITHDTADVHATGAVTVTTQSTADVEAQGAVTVQTPATVTLDTPNTICTGNLTIVGSLLSGTGGSGATATLNGALQINGPSVTHNSKSIGDTHTHPQSGGGTTGVPS